MKKLLIASLSISGYLFTNAQDTLIVQYENLKQVSFSYKIATTELKGVKVFYGNSSDLFLECLITISQDEKLANKERFDRNLQIFIEGFSSSESWKYFQREQVDTSLGGVDGILVHYHSSSKPAQLQESFNFFTIVNKRQYVILVGALKELTVAMKKEIDDVFKTVVFEGTN